MNDALDQKQTQWHPNRSYLQLSNGITIDSCFPAGNIASANLLTTSPLTIQVEGNTDINLDNASKYWLYFRIRGFKKDKPIKFILKNANHLRKYYGQNRYKPYMMVKQEEDVWQSCSTPIDLTILQNGHIQGVFMFQSQKYAKLGKSNKSTNDLFPQKQEKIQSTTSGKEDIKKGSCYFAIYQPYCCQDLTIFLDNIKKKQQEENSSNNIYFHEETIVYSYERRKIPLITITSLSNIESFSEKQPIISQEIFPIPKERPHKLKNNPVILVTSRVHPSETSASFFIEGLIQFLMSDCKESSILRELFIIQIIPMLNPDGVQHGNFRYDHELKNLNRYYGQSSIDKTPSIRAAELLISYYKNRNNQQCQFTEFYEETYNRLFMYVDVHGHSSAMPSFIYGNHTDKMQYLIENKVFCKLIQSNFISGGFSKLQSQFSKRNMTIQEKYDEFSKECSGRVFAGRADTTELSIFHSYTMEVLPYWEEYPRKKGDNKDKISAAQYARLLGKAMMISLLDLLELNPESKYNEVEMDRLRRCIAKQCQSEQSRKVFLSKRAQSSIERCPNSQISKPKQNQRDYNFQNEYIQRWFSNHFFLKHLMGKTHLIKDPKSLKFCQKIAKIMQLPTGDLLQSPRKENKCKSVQPQLKNEQKQKYRLSETTKKDEDVNQSPSLIRNSKCFLSKDEKKSSYEDRVIVVSRSKKRHKAGSKINKHTIELKQEFKQIIPRHKTFDKETNQKFPKRQYAIKKEVNKKESIESTQRYEKQVLNKIHSNAVAHRNPMFEIKVKEIRAKPKSNIRILTETAIGEVISTTGDLEPTSGKIKSCNSQVENFHCRQKITTRQNEYYKNNYHKPSFIEQFIIKIREERENAINNAVNSKLSNREELKQKALKFRPSIKEKTEDQQQNILPVLRRNKIFTIMSEPNQKEGGLKGYDSLMQSKKRTATMESEGNVDELIRITKRMLGSNKKQDFVHDNIFKKSSHMS